MAKSDKEGLGSFISKNFLGISILASTVVIAFTVIYVFGPDSGTVGDSGTAAVLPVRNQLAVAGDPLSDANLEALAVSVGADGNEFTVCLNSGRYTEAVQRDFDQGSSLGVNGTPSFLINGRLVVGALPFSQISSAIDEALASGGGSGVDIGDAPALGDDNAPVTMVEFSDYQCPFCRRFFTSTLDQVKSEYVDTGKVKFVYKDFPLSNIHSRAQATAEAVRCVRDQLGEDGYWKMHDAVFSAQG